MPKDFAGRSSATGTKKSKPRKRRASPKNRVLFHGPSFSSGAIIGAAIVILAAYAPELIESTVPKGADTSTQKDDRPTVTFDFPKLLKESEVKADPSNYAPPKPQERTTPEVFNIQAASFRDVDDAHELRARLLLSNLPAQVDSSIVEDILWFRVKVGPFSRKVEADRAMTQLRERRLTPIWLNNHN